MIDLKKILDRIVEYNDLPKFQVDRALSAVVILLRGAHH